MISETIMYNKISGNLECLVCGQKKKIILPCGQRLLGRLIKSFQQDHEKCLLNKYKKELEAKKNGNGLKS